MSSAAAAQEVLKITKQARDVAVRAGESAMFECHIGGPADVEVDWLSDGKLIQPALLNCKMHFDGKRWCHQWSICSSPVFRQQPVWFNCCCFAFRCRLLLNSVHEDDSGTYTCKLSTAKGEEQFICRMIMPIICTIVIIQTTQ